MNLTLRTDFGCTEALIDEDCSLNRFYEVANILANTLDIQFKTKEDDADTVIWHFPCKNSSLSLQYNIYTGISLFPEKFRAAGRRENDAVIEVAKYLQKELLLNTRFHS